MEILSFSLGALQANCYLVVDKQNRCLIFDPGDEAVFILEEIQRRNLQPIAILATHGHFDHIMAAGEIQQSFDIPLYINQKDQFLVDRAEETAEYFLGYKPAILPIKKLIYLRHDKRDFGEQGSFKLKIVRTPGHTPGSVCFYFEKEKILFSGDTLFKEAIGRYDFSYSSKKDLDNSLKKLLQLPPNVIVYPGHGEITMIAEARSFLEF
jgi:glyoxylase-like metal-dependent hydrolase (beta-lactamase superfamily II)